MRNCSSTVGFRVQALAYEKLVEAPWGIKETSTPLIVFLAARDDVACPVVADCGRCQQLGHGAPARQYLPLERHLNPRRRVSNGFNLWKQRTELSYRDVGAFDSFAQRAHVVTEYPAGTLLIDDYLGLEIQFRLPGRRAGRVQLHRSAGEPAAGLCRG